MARGHDDQVQARTRWHGGHGSDVYEDCVCHVAPAAAPGDRAERRCEAEEHQLDRREPREQCSGPGRDRHHCARCRPVDPARSPSPRRSGDDRLVRNGVARQTPGPYESQRHQRTNRLVAPAGNVLAEVADVLVGTACRHPHAAGGHRSSGTSSWAMTLPPPTSNLAPCSTSGTSEATAVVTST